MISWFWRLKLYNIYLSCNFVCGTCLLCFLFLKFLSSRQKKVTKWISKPQDFDLKCSFVGQHHNVTTTLMMNWLYGEKPKEVAYCTYIHNGITHKWTNGLLFHSLFLWSTFHYSLRCLNSKYTNHWLLFNDLLPRADQILYKCKNSGCCENYASSLPFHKQLNKTLPLHSTHSLWKKGM